MAFQILVDLVMGVGFHLAVELAVEVVVIPDFCAQPFLVAGVAVPDEGLSRERGPRL